MHRPSPRLARSLALCSCFVLAAIVGCFRGYELEDKEPPPGYPGGVCVSNDCPGIVECYTEHQLCYDPQEPCKGIYCGGNGTCLIDMDNGNKPMCQCDIGYNNDAFAFYCVPG